MPNPKSAETFAERVRALGIVASPDVCFGEPRIAARRVTVETLVSRFRAGDSVASIAADFEIATLDVENAIRFAMLSRRRRKHWLSVQLGAAAEPSGPQIDVSGDSREGLRRMVEQNARILSQDESERE